MKCVSQIVIFCLVAGYITVSIAEESGPWGFKNIAIINIPSRNVNVLRSLDRRGVELQFEKWSPEFEDSIKDALSKSPLRYRLFPLRQTTMAVEIYSITSDVDFAAKPTKNQTQVVIGEVRQEKATADLLNIDKIAKPVPRVAKLVRLGKYTSARNQLYKSREKHSHGRQFLYRARISLIDHLKRGRSAIKCPNIPGIEKGDPKTSEAIILTAWCNKERNNPDLALDYLDLLRRVKPNEHLTERINELEEIIISSRVLSMDRRGKHIRAAGNALKHLNVIKTSLKEISFIETVAENLILTNLADPLARMIQDMIAKDKRKRVRELEPVLVESYLASDKYVLAMDAANYFLFRPQPTWNKGRLLRGFGWSMLQSGNWKAAYKALKESKELGVAWTMDESIALIEAALRSQTMSPEELNGMLDDFIETNRRIDGFRKQWFNRLADEIDLKQGRNVSPKRFKKLPGHVLYQAAQDAKKSNQPERASEILKHIDKSMGGWQVLAKTVTGIEQMQKEIKSIEQMLEEMK